MEQEIQAIASYLNEEIDIPNMNEKMESILFNIILLICVLILFFIFQ